jgi:hypothetical protein
MDDESQRAVYAAEFERYLAEACQQSLLTERDERRLRAAYQATADQRRPPASMLPQLLLDAEDTGALDGEASLERASARWDVYERIRQQTQDDALNLAEYGTGPPATFSYAALMSGS